MRADKSIRCIRGILLLSVIFLLRGNIAYGAENVRLFSELMEEQPVESVAQENEIQFWDLEESYDPRTDNIMTSVKDQGSYGTCWAFTTMAILETNGIKKEILSQEEADLSERHLAYYTYYPVGDKLGNTIKDQTVYTKADMSFLSLGGNVSLGWHRLANWQGAVSEEAAPYENAQERLPASIESAYEKDVIHLKNCYIFSIKDTAWIKRAIKEYGAVGFSQYALMGMDSTAYYDANNFSYYCPYDLTTNHAITVVGWDDNYPAENFIHDPGSDGAWLVKNSLGDAWGDQGYFWLSYQDASLGNNAYVLEADRADNYDNNYQYDGTVLDDIEEIGYGTGKMANVFQVSANPSGTESLEAVSFCVHTPNLEYSVQIYGNLKDKKDPESGTALLKEPIEGTTLAAGLYTVDLESAVELSQGQDFSVVITLQKEDSEIRVYSEGSRLYAGVMQSQASANEGESFYKAESEWTDYGSLKNGNLRIKAYTNNIANLPDEDGDSKDSEDDSRNDNKGESGDDSQDNNKGESGDNSQDNNKGETGVRLPFKDVERNDGNWKYESIKYVYEKNLMKGIQNADKGLCFEPDSPMSRAMFVTVLYRMAGSPAVAGEIGFVDVAEGSWYSDAVKWARENGIVQGISRQQFAPQENVTREQMAKMLKCFSDIYNGAENINISLQQYRDKDEISLWAEEYMEWAVGSGIIQGKKIAGNLYLAPKEDASRAECAAMISRFHEKSMQLW